MYNGEFTNGPQGGGPWDTDLDNDTNLLPVPSLGLTNSSLPYITNAMGKSDQVSPGTQNNFSILVGDHLNDAWQSADTSGFETLGNPNTSLNEGASMAVTNTTFVSQSLGTNYFTHNVDVWLQPGSIAYYYQAGNSVITAAYVSDYTNPTKHVNVVMASGSKLDLVVPGYILDGLFYDGLDLAYPDNPDIYPPYTGYPRFRQNNFQEGYMWPDDSTTPNGGPFFSTSLMRQLMFRNYPNLLTGFYVFRADDPMAAYTPSRAAGQQGIEPLITDQTNSAGAVGAPRPLYGLGAYYPSAGFYWPFGGDTDDKGFVTNAVGLDYDPTYALPNPTADPDPSHSEGLQGGSRHIAYSINMLSTNAAPEWYGELFYNSTTGGGTNSASGTSNTTVSKIMQSADWKINLPTFLAAFNSTTGIMIDEPNHNPNIVGTPSVWRPLTFNGSNSTTYLSDIVAGTVHSATGGFVMDETGAIRSDAMAWSGRPTHYYDFSRSSWEPITDNHDTNVQALQLGNWKAGEYAWHARAMGVTIYTVGYGTAVTAAQCAFLAQIANATNSISPGSPRFITNAITTFNPAQPIGQQFYATTAAQISNDFFSIGQAINAALTQ
jgi:hypothetical protein